MILVSALDPALSESKEDVFLSECQLTKALPHATDPQLARRLWTLSEELTDQKSEARM